MYNLRLVTNETSSFKNLVNNLSMDYDLYNYKAYFKIYNVLDEKYNTALDYSTFGRTFNFGLRKIY